MTSQFASLAEKGGLHDCLSYLVSAKVLDVISSDRIQAASVNSSQPLDVIVTELGLMRDLDLVDALNKFLGVSDFDTAKIVSDSVLIEQLGVAFLQAESILPIKTSDELVCLLIADPMNISAVNTVAFAVEKPVHVRVVSRSVLSTEIEALSQTDILEDDGLDRGQTSSSPDDDIGRLQDIASEAPVIQFVARTIQDAVKYKATDIHLEPTPDALVVRFRIDGLLTEMPIAPKAMHAGVVTRIKVLSRLNIAERRQPQDGRMRVAVRGDNIDLRISILPTINGESVVLRVLDKSNIPLDLDALGFELKAQRQLDELAARPNGIVLATGPTGSGKTTTLYAMLRKIMSPQLKVFTIEDPVEYKLDGAVQMQVNPEIGLGFADALRSVLRQDPDVILVGEIRDKETAEIAIRASLTGHLVFSTLHTNSAMEAITRLRDMGVDSFLLGATLRGIVAQRLLRRSCCSCQGTGIEVEQEGEGKTCTECTGSGFNGRRVTYEIASISQELSEGISSGENTSVVFSKAVKNGFLPMITHAGSLVVEGKTTMSEVKRVVDIETQYDA